MHASTVQYVNFALNSITGALTLSCSVTQDDLPVAATTTSQSACRQSDTGW